MFLRVFKSQCVRYFSRFNIGDSVIVKKKITNDDLINFAKLTGDTNSVHFPKDHQRGVVHGALLNGLVSGVIGTKLPGPGTLVISQTLNFPKKCFTDETVTVIVELVEIRKIIKVKFSCEVTDQNKIVLYGDAKLIQNK